MPENTGNKHRFIKNGGGLPLPTGWFYVIASECLNLASTQFGAQTRA